MSSLRLLASQLNVSRTTVSAALRGHSWVTASTRQRVLRCAERNGYRFSEETLTLRGTIAVLRVSTGTQRRAVAVERHRLITRAARETAAEMAYGVEEFVAESNGRELEQQLEAIEARGFQGILVLPGLNADLLSRVLASKLPCVYADVPPDDVAIDSVSPDYHQGMHLALTRLRVAGYNKPGLVLDNDLSFAARERLIAAYASGFPVATYASGFPMGGASSPAPFIIPARTLYNFEIWMRRHSFDSLLTTDCAHAERLACNSPRPLFGLLSDTKEEEGGLSLNLANVGRLALETLYARIERRGQRFPQSCLSVTASWTTPRWVKPKRAVPFF